jgi:beta-1,2-mannobiose phosphorylase / 1,2-beta-oligomannan phosphorylase
MNRSDADQIAKISIDNFTAQFTPLGVVLHPDDGPADCEGVLNPASARLSDGTLRLYPRMMARGNVSSIGCFRAEEQADGTLALAQLGYALEPEVPYELRNESDGYGCEDPRITFIAAIERYVMAYVAFGPEGPKAAIAVSTDGVVWKRLGLVLFKTRKEHLGDKDAAFFPEPVLSPSGVQSLALYHRPSLWASSRKQHEGIAIGYIPLDPVRNDLRKICEVAETHPLRLPAAHWGHVKVGDGTPPVRIREGWLAVIHGVDELPSHDGKTLLRYCAGIIVHEANRLDQVLYRSPTPLFGPPPGSEVRGKAVQVVFPTALDPRPDLGERVFDIYYGMNDREVWRGRLTLNL